MLINNTKNNISTNITLIFTPIRSSTVSLPSSPASTLLLVNPDCPVHNNNDATNDDMFEDDDDDEEEDANDENFDGLNRDPERLKAFNVSAQMLPGELTGWTVDLILSFGNPFDGC